MGILGLWYRGWSLDSCRSRISSFAGLPRRLSRLLSVLESLHRLPLAPIRIGRSRGDAIDVQMTIRSPAVHLILCKIVLTPWVVFGTITHSSTLAPMIAALFSRTSFKRGNQSLFINLSGFPSIWTVNFSLATDTGRGMVPYDPVISTLPFNSWGMVCTIVHVQIYSSVELELGWGLTSIFKLKVLEHSTPKIGIPSDFPTFHSTSSVLIWVIGHDYSKNERRLVPSEIVEYIQYESSFDILSVSWQVESIIQALMLRAGNYGFAQTMGYVHVSG